MTTLGLDYLRHQETRRSNLANEAETKRSNIAKETETQRHNLVTEDQAVNELAETITHNRNTETLESIKAQAQQAHYERQDAETERANKAKEAETQRANKAKELMDSLSGLEGSSGLQLAVYLQRNAQRLKEAGLSQDEIYDITKRLESGADQRRYFDRIWNLLSGSAKGASGAALTALLK